MSLDIKLRTEFNARKVNTSSVKRDLAKRLGRGSGDGLWIVATIAACVVLVSIMGAL